MSIRDFDLVCDLLVLFRMEFLGAEKFEVLYSLGLEMVVSM